MMAFDFYYWANLLWAPIAAVLLVFLIVRLTIDLVRYNRPPARPDFFRPHDMRP